MALSVVAVLFLLAIVSGCTNSQSSPEVAAPAGTFRGTVLTSLQGHPFKAFMGIPFALPPVGNLRFQKPQPYPKIDGTFDATALGPRCIQPEGVHLGDNEQEDCLYLNVYVPYTDNQDI